MNKVEREITVAAQPKDVWRALTDEALLSEWLAPEVELDPEEGGELFVRTEDGEERWGTVDEVEEGRRLAFTWGDSSVELTVGRRQRRPHPRAGGRDRRPARWATGARA